MKYNITTAAPAELDVDVLALIVAPDDLEGDPLEGLDPELTELLREEGFGGEAGQAALVRRPQGMACARLLVVGAGAAPPRDLRAAAARAARRATKLRCATVGVALAGGPLGQAELTALAEGLAHGAYDFDRYVSAKLDEEAFEGISRVEFMASSEDEALTEALEAAVLRNRGVRLARNLVNEPPMSMTPARLAQAALEVATRHGLEHTILEADELRVRGFELILGVGQGSDNPPRLIHLTYRPDGEVHHRLALIGKGVTFDTGGYNIKTGGHMFNMHSDMAGGAAVLGAAEALGALAPPGVEVHFIVPTAENSISGDALRPNDILRGYGKKTVEIHNTDAEGRLILADALAYAQEHEVDTIVDLATLTGACVVALGERTCGLFARDEGLYAQLEAALEVSGEDMWRMPLTKALDAQLDTPVADMRNVGERAGGAITAALFLGRWVDMKRWAHLDIAGPAFATSSSEAQAQGGTGFGVTTLVALIDQLEADAPG